MIKIEVNEGVMVIEAAGDILKIEAFIGEEAYCAKWTGGDYNGGPACFIKAAARTAASPDTLEETKAAMDGDPEPEPEKKPKFKAGDKVRFKKDAEISIEKYGGSAKTLREARAASDILKIEAFIGEEAYCAKWTGGDYNGGPAWGVEKVAIFVPEDLLEPVEA